MAVFCGVRAAHAYGTCERYAELHLDFDVDTCWESQIRQRLNNLRRRPKDIDETLVNAHLELFAGVLVDERRAVDRELGDFGGQWDRSHGLAAVAFDGIGNLPSRLIDNLAVVRTQLDANALLGFFSFLGHDPLEINEQYVVSKREDRRMFVHFVILYFFLISNRMHSKERG